MTAQFWAVGFAILGFCLIVAEFFIPSGGMISLSCAASFVASVFCAYEAWFDSSPAIFWSFSLGLSVLIPSFLVVFLRILEQSSLGNHLLLPKPDPKDVLPYQNESERLDRLIGRRGVAMTSMNPGGIVRVENDRLHAVTEGLLLNNGDEIEVTGVRGNCVVVRRARAEVFQAHTSADGQAPCLVGQPPSTDTSLVIDSPNKSAEVDRLDFDIPQN